MIGIFNEISNSLKLFLFDTVLSIVTVCEDIGDRCDDFAAFCGINDYVTGRCQKTCGICGTQPTTVKPTTTPKLTTTEPGFEINSVYFVSTNTI